MTRAQERSEGFTLHVSVAKRWWLYDLPYAREATRFLHERLSSRAVKLVAIDTIEFQVFDGIAKELGSDLDSFLAQEFARDVVELFTELKAERILHLVPQQPLLQAAFLTAALYRVALADAATLILAQDSGWPLLLADPTLQQLFAARLPEPAAASVAWLPDYLSRR